MTSSPSKDIIERMKNAGATRVLFKLLSNNDNSKNQIYFGGEFEVLRIIPHGEITSSYSNNRGATFKAPVSLSWITSNLSQPPIPAPFTQLIYYPKYPEVRLSGFLRGASGAPSELMQPPSQSERLTRANSQRCLALGIKSNNSIIAYVSTWGDPLSIEIKNKIDNKQAKCIASVFYEVKNNQRDDKEILIEELSIIYKKGLIPSSKLTSDGQLIPYTAQNGAGYTLEGQFGIIPNGLAAPDHMGWELKAHSRSVVTLMTPEPDSGLYLEDLGEFLRNYGQNSETRRDFTGKHSANIACNKTGLTLRMEGYDPHKACITDNNGGLILRDKNNNIAASWSFSKILAHWSKKHNKTAYITYSKSLNNNTIHYQFGPKILLCEGTDIKHFLTALNCGSIYYDPGVNQKLTNGRWTPKKRNQFRSKFSDIKNLYQTTEELTLGK